MVEIEPYCRSLAVNGGMLPSHALDAAHIGLDIARLSPLDGRGAPARRSASPFFRMPSRLSEPVFAGLRPRAES